MFLLSWCVFCLLCIKSSLRWKVKSFQAQLSISQTFSAKLRMMKIVPQVAESNQFNKRSKRINLLRQKMNFLKVSALLPSIMPCFALIVMLIVVCLTNGPVPLVLGLLSGRMAQDPFFLFFSLTLGALGALRLGLAGKIRGWAQWLSARKVLAGSSPTLPRRGAKFHASDKGSY